MQIAIAKAKAQFAELIRRAEEGEVIELTRHGYLVAKITAANRPVDKPLIGAMEGAFVMPDDIFDGDDEITDMFEQSSAN